MYFLLNLVSLINKLFPKNFFTGNPLKIKIDLYKYMFTSIEERDKNGQFWRKTFLKEFFKPVTKHQLQKVFENYSLPRIDNYRNVLISPFQLINIMDIVITIIFLYVTKNIFFRR